MNLPGQGGPSPLYNHKMAFRYQRPKCQPSVAILESVEAQVGAKTAKQTRNASGPASQVPFSYLSFLLVNMPGTGRAWHTLRNVFEVLVISSVVPLLVLSQTEAASKEVQRRA